MWSSVLGAACAGLMAPPVPRRVASAAPGPASAEVSWPTVPERTLAGPGALPPPREPESRATDEATWA